jgi:hypothetical protein
MNGPIELLLNCVSTYVGADSRLSHFTLRCRHSREPLEPTRRPHQFKRLGLREWLTKTSAVTEP